MAQPVDDILNSNPVKISGGDEANFAGVPTTTPALSDPGIITRNLPYEPNFYSATSGQFTSAATATDVATITGSATKTIRIKRVRITGTTTSGSPIGINIRIIKRSAANTGGTSVNDTEVPYDSSSPAATATVVHYTANPSALGTAVGDIACSRTSFTQSGLTGGDLIYDFTENPIILHGTSQILAVNFNSVTVTGSNICIVFEWAEV